MKEAIIIIGGYNSLWPTYLKTARDLEDVAGLQAIGVPLMPWDWWAARQAGNASNLLRKLEETVAWARRRFQAERFILVGHSAGGVLARLYLSEQEVWGRVYAGVQHVTALITLGSPHCSDRDTGTGWYPADEANRLAPGTPYADRVRYRAVAGRYLQGRRDGSYKERRAFRTYSFFAGQGATWGDGLVPVSSARLDGAETVILERVAHSGKVARDWYGSSAAIVRRWWPEGLGDAR
jgi:pimeloyl-ACP methyl ester carboxylesterase